MRPRLRACVLLRLACTGGATRAEIVRDLAPYTSHKLSPALWRALADEITHGLGNDGLLTEHKQRLEATQVGRAAAASYFNAKGPLPSAWGDMRDARLVALALGMEGEGAARLKQLARPDDLRAMVLHRHFGVPLKGRATPSRLRAALAVAALERAFGNTIKSGLGSGSGLPAKAGRLLAGQLSSRPRDFGTDSRLVAALAAEAAGAVQTEADALRTAVVRRWLEPELMPSRGDAAAPLTQNHPPAVMSVAGPATARTKPANDAGLSPLAQPAMQRPDLKGFASAVLAAARPHAEGWPGSRKTFISLVWQTIRAEQAAWGLTEIEFKCMLAEAHKSGLVVLANADIKAKGRLKELQDSAVVYKNTVWHFVRVEG